MNPKAKPLLLILVLMVLLVAALRGQKRGVNKPINTMPNITVMLNLNFMGE